MGNLPIIPRLNFFDSTTMKFFRLTLLFLIFGSTQATARDIYCRVVGISDGDTLTCLQNNKPLKVRLLHIDAPESSQPYGQKAKQALANLAFKKQVKIEAEKYDRYQRLLGVVYDEAGNNLNLRLVEQGMAWAYRQTQPIYQQAQTIAQQQRIGLWQDPHALNPYQWRQQHKTAQSNNHLQKNSQNRPLVSSPDCQQKRSCNQIGNYQQALFYFQQCGWKELDGNNDGIPCNKLYRKAQRQ